MRCPGCGTEVASSRLACPACHRLLHGDELEALAAEAAAAREAGDPRRESAAWRRALQLLPPASRQHATISRRVQELSAELDGGAAPSASAGDEAAGKGKKLAGAAGLGALALLAWKLKAVIAFLVTKGKLLLAGLTKSGTVFSMLLSLGVYWAAFGWPFALGLVVSIYVHEMGHVAALRHYGIAASAPMFIPGIGAFVRLDQYPANPREDARVGLAGPIWGLAAAVAAWAVFVATAMPIWGAIAKLGAWINLFNLLPVWQLDGGRGFRALTRPMRFAVVATMAGCWWLSGEGLLVLLAIVGGFRAFGAGAPEEGDRLAFAQFLVLLVALSALCMIDVGIGG